MTTLKELAQYEQAGCYLRRRDASPVKPSPLYKAEDVIAVAVREARALRARYASKLRKRLKRVRAVSHTRPVRPVPRLFTPTANCVVGSGPGYKIARWCWKHGVPEPRVQDFTGDLEAISVEDLSAPRYTTAAGLAEQIEDIRAYNPGQAGHLWYVFNAPADQSPEKKGTT
jgi:hypothetical protein